MAKQKRPSASNEKKPSVRIVRPSGRPFQLRYFCPVEKREIRVSTGDRDEDEAERRKKELEAKLLLGLDTKSGKVKLTGPEMDWADFREQYRTVHGMHSGSTQLGKSSGLAAESSKAPKDQNIQTQNHEGATH